MPILRLIKSQKQIKKEIRNIMQHTKNTDISIVTMFFDIGRGNWSVNNNSFKRNNDDYFNYFNHLAKLNNDITIFTTDEFAERIQNIRKDKPTNIVCINLDDFQFWIDKIANIQQNPEFLAKIPENIKNYPEYISPHYVLIIHLKTYFINQVIQKNLVKHSQVAWIDFGYCRDTHTLGNIQNWQYPFDPNYIHLFTIRPHKLWGVFPHPRFPNTTAKINKELFRNKPYIIGGAMVAHQHQWAEFFKILTKAQMQLLRQNIINNEQMIYLQCAYQHPKLIQLHYLGKKNWFGTFQQFHL